MALPANRAPGTCGILSPWGKQVKKFCVLVFGLQLCLSGCAMRVGRGSNGTARAERLAMEKGKLAELTDPVARAKTYVVIADILLSFAGDSARVEDHDSFRALLDEY